MQGSSTFALSPDARRSAEQIWSNEGPPNGSAKDFRGLPAECLSCICTWKRRSATEEWEATSGPLAAKLAVAIMPPPPSVAGSSPGSRRSSIASNDDGMLSSDDDEAVGRRANGAHPPRPPPLPCLRLAASSPSGPSNSVSFAGAAAQPFKAFVRTASGQFNSTLEWMGVQRHPRSVLLHENFERSHFEPPRRRSSHQWGQESPKTCSSQTYSSTNASSLASPRYDEDGCWSRVDRRACSILLLVLLLVLTYTIGLKEHDDALEQALPYSYC